MRLGPVGSSQQVGALNYDLPRAAADWFGPVQMEVHLVKKDAIPTSGRLPARWDMIVIKPRPARSLGNQ